MKSSMIISKRNRKRTTLVNDMELTEACALSEGEEIILAEEDYVGRDEAIVLTNMRLIFLKSKGLPRHKTFEKDDELPRQDIESACYDSEFDAVTLKLKNGEKELIMFYEHLLGTLLKGDENLDVKLDALRNKWISAINTRPKLELPKRSRCTYCGQIYDEVAINCPRCGASR